MFAVRRSWADLCYFYFLFHFQLSSRSDFYPLVSWLLLLVVLFWGNNLYCCSVHKYINRFIKSETWNVEAKSLNLYHLIFYLFCLIRFFFKLITIELRSRIEWIFHVLYRQLFFFSFFKRISLLAWFIHSSHVYTTADHL